MDYEKNWRKGGTYEIPVEVFNVLLCENEELKRQLHECSLEIQSQIESTLECPSNCENIKFLQDRWNGFKKILKDSLDNENDIFSVMRVKDLLDKMQELEGDNND